MRGLMCGYVRLQRHNVMQSIACVLMPALFMTEGLAATCCASPGCYKFSRYKTGKVGNGQQQAPSSEEEKPMLLAPQGADM